MKRVLLGGMKHETLTFVPGLTDLNEFRRNHLVEGADVFSPARGSGQEIDGVIEVAQEEGIELIPTIDAFGAAAPPVADAAYAYIRDRILAGRAPDQGRLDGVMLALHGAMTTESLEDPEGDLITRVREIVGPNVPISVSFDMHCHLTDLTVRARRHHRRLPHPSPRRLLRHRRAGHAHPGQGHEGRGQAGDGAAQDAHDHLGRDPQHQPGPR